MKKILYYSILLFLQYSSLTFCWEVRVLPVSRDPMTGQWNILLGRDAGGQWSEFRMVGKDEKKVSHYVAQVLQKQTHGAYNLDEKDIETTNVSLRFNNGDFLYALPVAYTSDPNLHKIMRRSVGRDLTKDQFVWLPIEEIFQRRTVVKLFRGTEAYKVEQGIRSLIMQHWNKDLVPRLNALADVNKINVKIVDNSLKRYIDAKKNPMPTQQVSSVRALRNAPKTVSPKKVNVSHRPVLNSGGRVARREYS